MTAIAINLLIEEELTQRAQARDPFKLAVIIGCVLVGLTFATGLLLGRIADGKTEEAAALQTKWDSMQAKPAGGGVDTKSLQLVANDYVAINQARSLYAPQLALIKDVIPDSIQLVSIRLGFVTETIAPSAPPPGVSEAKAARAAKPKTVEHLDLVLDGSTTCARPEIEVDQFIKSLRAHPDFSKFLEDVRLRSITRTTPKSENGAAVMPSANFSVDCIYKGTKEAP